MSRRERPPHERRRWSSPGLLATAVAAATLVGAAAATDAALAAGCAGAEAPPMQVRQTTIAGTTLCLLNAERRGRGLSPLRLRTQLSAAALRHSRDMVSRRYFAHTAPGGSGPLQRIRRSGYLRSAKRWSLGENLAWGSAAAGSADAIVRAWMNSPPHRKSILEPSYRDVGIGVVWGVPPALPPAGATYTVDFGVKH